MDVPASLGWKSITAQLWLLKHVCSCFLLMNSSSRDSPGQTFTISIQTSTSNYHTNENLNNRKWLPRVMNPVPLSFDQDFWPFSVSVSAFLLIVYNYGTSLKQWFIMKGEDKRGAQRNNRTRANSSSSYWKINVSQHISLVFCNCNTNGAEHKP